MKDVSGNGSNHLWLAHSLIYKCLLMLTQFPVSLLRVVFKSSLTNFSLIQFVRELFWTLCFVPSRNQKWRNTYSVSKKQTQADNQIESGKSKLTYLPLSTAPHSCGTDSRFPGTLSLGIESQVGNADFSITKKNQDIERVLDFILVMAQGLSGSKTLHERVELKYILNILS